MCEALQEEEAVLLAQLQQLRLRYARIKSQFVQQGYERICAELEEWSRGQCAGKETVVARA